MTRTPKGWRRLRRGTILREGDKGRFWYIRGFRYTLVAGCRAGYGAADAKFYIRRRAKSARKGGT